MCKFFGHHKVRLRRNTKNTQRAQRKIQYATFCSTNFLLEINKRTNLISVAAELPIAYCTLPIAFAYCLLPVAYCPWLTIPDSVDTDHLLLQRRFVIAE